MLPPLRIVRHGLRRTTEALAAELARGLRLVVAHLPEQLDDLVRPER